MSDIRLGMLIDLSRCVGCNACAVACKQENSVPLGKFNTWIESWDVVDGSGRVRRANLPRLCNHCTDAPCVDVCPTGASFHAEDGTVQIDPDKCIGCKYCMAACPYTGVRSFNWEEPKYFLDFAVGDEDAPKHQKHVVEKCTMCWHRVAKGEEPACVEACPGRARIWGDLDDPDSEVSQAVKGREYQHLLPEQGTNPSVYYLV